MMKETTVKYLSLLSWRRPWVWLLSLFLLYNLALAVIAPLIIKKQLDELIVNQLKLNLDIDGITINPYKLSVAVNNLKISGQELGQPIGFEHLFINFQLLDSLGGIWTIKEVHLTGIYGEFKRIDANHHNFTPVIDRWLANTPTSAEENNTSNENFPRLRLEDIKLQISRFKVIDQLPKSHFETEIGPIDFTIQHLSSLPNALGQHSLHLKTNNNIELHWQGDIGLTPIASQGDVQISGPLLTTLADYLKDDIKVAVDTNNLQAKFHYSFSKPENSDLKATLSGIEASAQDLKVSQRSDGNSLLALKQVSIHDGQLQWPDATFELGRINLDSGDVWVHKTPEGILNVEQLIEESESTDDESAPWEFITASLSVNNINFHYTDQSTTSPSKINVSNIALNVKNLSNKEHQAVDVAASFNLEGGKFESTATLQLNPLANAQGTYKISQLPVKAAQSFVEAYALVDITEGELAAQGKISSIDDVIKIQGTAQVDNLKVLEKSSGNTILSWSQLKLSRIIADLKEQKVNVGRMRFEKAYADFNIFPDGTHTLSRILKEPEPATTSAETETATSNGFSYLIGRIDFENASGKFSDASLPLPFSADIANITGSISTLDSTSHSPASVKLEGQVSEYGEMVMTGAIFPLEPKQKTRMKITFNNIDIAEFSPYSIKFAGREIAQGKMDLDLEYDIDKSQMRGKNNLVLHDFALGKKVEQPGAVDLPLDLAVALLKDKDGVIRADLPVQGNVDDPKFGYGKTIRQAIRKLITNVAAAPFRFLAGLVGVGKNKDLGYISFFAGRTDLSPAQQEKVKQLGEALIKRPDLQITIGGVYSASFDTASLKEEKFDAKLREQISKGLTDANIGSRKYVSTLEKLYEEKGLTPELNELKRNAQNQTRPDDGENLDQLTYIKAVKEALVATESIAAEDLIQLADKRAQEVYQKLIQTPGVNPVQIVMAAAYEGQLNKEGKLKLELGANLKKKKKKKKTT
ncbi:MAG TPA: DUF748 domain-containing protein [Cellvibrio sp.]|nr:DUF748 domain-containing protein [Cellvibrio sp.]